MAHTGNKSHVTGRIFYVACLQNSILDKWIWYGPRYGDPEGFRCHLIGIFNGFVENYRLLSTSNLRKIGHYNQTFIFKSAAKWKACS